jgi:hypothetical protein
MMRKTLAAALLAAAATANPSSLFAQAAPSPPSPYPASSAFSSVFNPSGGDSRWETTVPVIAAGPWNGPRTADGQPDISGDWSNTIANHANFTDPQAGDPGYPSKAANLPRDQRAPSRVSDPADGHIPYLPAARALQQDYLKNFPEPSHAWHVEPLARCAPAGVPKSFLWHGFSIRQYPGAVLLLFDSGTRIIHLDDGRHLPDAIKLWNGDSHGHWEGNTLVVEVTNNNGKALFGRTGDFMSENGTVAERYIFAADGKRFNYVATFTDPTVYSRPWTATVPARRFTEADPADDWFYNVSAANRPGQPLLNERMEQICVEHNGSSDGGLFDLPPDGPVIDR